MVRAGRLGQVTVFIEKTEVTNAAYAKFVAAGGYTKEDYWSAAGRLRLPNFVDGTGALGPAFDHVAVAGALGAALDRDLDPARLPLDRFAIVEATRALRERLRAERGWEATPFVLWTDPLPRSEAAE